MSTTVGGVEQMTFQPASGPVRPAGRAAPDGVLDAVRVAARRRLSGSGSHDWQHTLRVYRLCERIGPEEGADMFVLRAAALLHDIGRCFQDESRGRICHARKGAELAAGLLADLDVDPDLIAGIIHCIRTHRFRDGLEPETIEARVLFDADKLDAIGAVGVARAYMFAGEHGACLHNPDVDVSKARPYSADDTGYREYVVKLSRIKQRMLTATGRRLAAGRHAFMKAFFKRFLLEYEGIK